MVYVREDESFHTCLCIYNYFSELFPEEKSGATAYLWFFDSSGSVIASPEVRLAYRGQLQFDLAQLGTHFEGTAGVSLVPETLPAFKPAGVGTGYYARYFDNRGHADFSHEWDPMKFEPSQSPPWLCVVRPLDFPDTQLIVMSAYYGLDGTTGRAQWIGRLRNGQGRLLFERRMPPLPPRGTIRLPLQEIFPEISEWATREGTVAVEVSGSNIMGPFTWVRAPGGDFNLHHFC